MFRSQGAQGLQYMNCHHSTTLNQNLLMVLVVAITNSFCPFQGRPSLLRPVLQGAVCAPMCQVPGLYHISENHYHYLECPGCTIYHYNDQIFLAISTFIMIISWLFQNSGLHPRHGPVLAPRVFCLLWLFCSGWRCWCLSQVADVDGWWHSLLEGSF